MVDFLKKFINHDSSDLSFYKSFKSGEIFVS